MTLKLTPAGLSCTGRHGKHLLLAGLFLLFFNSVALCQWVKNIGGQQADFGQAVKVDANGNVFVTGNFAGTADFDPGPGVFNLQSNCPCDQSNPPKSDIFLAKYDVNGNFIWAINIGGGEADKGKAIDVDPAGNVYITGDFATTADFDPGPGTRNLTSAGNTDIFLAKYNTNGQLVWANSFGNIIIDAGISLAVDNNSNVFLTGSFNGVVDFDPGAGVTSFNSGNTGDVFFAKYAANGDLVWARDIAGTGEETGRSIATGPGGTIYLSGTFFGTSDLDPGAGVTNLTGTDAQDAFFAKYTPAGDLLWAKSIGSTGDQVSVDIAVDADGNLYTGGYFGGSVDFDPGPGSTILTSSTSGFFDGFLLKLTTDGDFQWAFQTGSPTGEDNTLSVTTDIGGNVYICGSFQGTVDFDHGPATHNITGGGNELYFAKYSSSGNFIWAESAGGPAEEVAAGIDVDPSGNVYLTGYFTGTSSFETGAGAINLTSAGNADVFLLKFLSSGTLPLNLLSVSAVKVNKTVVLNWKVTSEINNYGFEIEKASGTGLQQDKWQKTGFVKGVAGGNTIHDYQFTDESPGSGKVFYRLKQIDIDGHFKYSRILFIDMPSAGQYSLGQNVPNPVRGATTIHYSLAANSRFTIVLYNATGKKIRLLESGTKESGSYTLEADCSNLSPGIYYYKMVTEKMHLTKKMIVIK